MLEIYDFSINYRENPTGIDGAPVFRWKLKSDRQENCQKSVILEVYDSIEKRFIWKYEYEGRNMEIQYDGAPFSDLRRYQVQLQVFSTGGDCAKLNQVAEFTTGYADEKAWKAKWIVSGYKSEVCPMFQKQFRINKKIRTAYACVSAMGIYELYVDGKKMGNTVFSPGWSSYKKEINYQIYDLKEYLKTGEHFISILVGKGWYGGNLTWNQTANLYGDDVGCIVQIEINYEDGTTEYISSDETWKWCDSYITYAQIYNGEYQDLTKAEKPEIFIANNAVKISEGPGGRLRVSLDDGIQEMEKRKPCNIFRSPAGNYVVDMGQNMTGWLHIKLQGKNGDRIKLRFGEILDQEGNVYYDNLRSAKQEAVYLLKNGTNELCEHFTYHGFRYVEVIEYPAEPSIQDFEGIVLYTNMKETLKFECDNKLVNQFINNVKWSQKDNFTGVPTDCPQRDERLGWTGDAQIFIPTSCYNYQCDAFWEEWLNTLRNDQYESGSVPFIVPDVLPHNWDCLGDWDYKHTSAAWGDAAVVCPWILYKFFGNKRILEKSYESMKAFVEYVRCGGKDELVWDWGPQLGDWLALDSKEDSYYGATSTAYTATVYYARSVRILSEAAVVLKKTGDAEEYRELYKRIYDRFQTDWIRDNKIIEETQTAQALAITFGLLTEEQQKEASQKLSDLLKKNKGLLNTGFVGTPELCKALSMTGRTKEAEELFLKTEYPSWLYQVKKGATSVWEHWDGIKENGDFWSSDMNSFNHYSYGSVEEWLVSWIAGITQEKDSSGFSKILLRPFLESSIKKMYCSYESIKGTIVCAWEKKGRITELYLEVPFNTEAILEIQGLRKNILPGKYQFYI